MFEGKTALVTGAGRGIGAAVAKALAEKGAHVILASRTNEELEAVAGSIKEKGHVCDIVPTDVGSESEIKSLFIRTLELSGPVDILVNCAGAIIYKFLEFLSLEEWNEIQSVNVNGTFLCCREAIRQMKGRGGSIVNVSSLGGVTGTGKFPGYSAYTTSKYAVIGLTESLAVELLPLGIRVNCVAPGAVDTAMLRKAAPGLKTKTTPEDIARIILFLCDETQSRSLNGSVIQVHSNLPK